jgi:multidrug efflux pump subunit AcrB
VPGTREVTTIGGPGRVVQVLLDQEKLNAHGLAAADLKRALQAANTALPAGTIVRGNETIYVETGEFLQTARAVRELVVGVPLSELVEVQPVLREKTIYHKDLLPVTYVVADMAGKIDSPLYGMFGARGRVGDLAIPNNGRLTEHFITQPPDPYRGYALKWDGEWQVTYETFRDMGIAYAVGLVLIYLLVVAQFGSYVTPLVIMAPIPPTIIGVMPGHALLGAPFTATSMIGMIALAGIIVRNSILLVDFVNLQLAKGVPFAQAIVDAAAARAKPIALTGLAAMLGAFFILDDPIFNGLAIALVFGILVSTLLTLVVIPVLYYAVNRYRYS